MSQTNGTTFSTRRKIRMFGRPDRPSIMATGPTGRVLQLVEEGGCWHLIQRTSPAEADSFPMAVRAQLVDWLGAYRTLTAAKAAASKWLEARGR
jgi:hypothetical protein